MPCPTLRELLSALSPEGALWHRRRGGTRWRRFGTYPSVPLAYEAMLAEQAAGATGDWYACRAGMTPADRDDEADLITIEPSEGRT